MSKREIKKYPVTVAEEGVKKTIALKSAPLSLEKKETPRPAQIEFIKGVSDASRENNGIKLIQGDALKP